MYDLYGLSASENKWISWLYLGCFLIAFLPAAGITFWLIDFSKYDHPEPPNYHATKLYDVDGNLITVDGEDKSQAEPVPDGAVGVQVDSPITPKGASLDFVNLCYEVYPTGEDGKPYTKRLLNNISAYCHPGMMVALMGASGAGTFFALTALLYLAFSTEQMLDSATDMCDRSNASLVMLLSSTGKTTLLDVLAGKKTTGKITGQLLINGKPRGVSKVK
jgi:hypothetical protein